MVKKSFPQGGGIVLAGEFLERFSFWGLQSLIVLYLINVVNYSNSQAVIIQAGLASISFLFSIIGGLLIDRFIGAYFSIKLGTIITILGNLILAAFNQPQASLLGLSLIALGAGMFIPSNPNILSSLYEKEADGREYGFTLLYLCTNLGGALAPLIYGLLAKYHHWNVSYYLSAFSLLIWYFIFFNRSPHLKGHSFKSSVIAKQPWVMPSGLIGLASLAYFLMNQPSFTGIAVALILLVTIAYIIFQVRNHEKPIYKTITYLFLMIFCCMWFFSTEFQVNNSFLLFVDQFVNKEIGSLEIPVPFFASFEPLFVVLLAPLLARVWLLLKSTGVKISLIKITMGLFLECLAFYWMAYVTFLAMVSNITIPFIWLIPVYLLLGIGELLVMPIVISNITEKIPEKLKGTFLGLLYLSLSSSAYLSGLIATMALKPLGNQQAITGYYHSYLNVAHISLCVVLLLGIFLVIMYAKRLIIWNKEKY